MLLLICFGNCCKLISVIVLLEGRLILNYFKVLHLNELILKLGKTLY